MQLSRNDFLPTTKADMNARGWSDCDFILITGDGYVDHPSFGAAVIGRVLEDEGYKVGIIAQPDYKKVESFQVLGKPRLAFLITAGNMDSMVANYTVNRRLRRKDGFSPGGIGGKRPDRALIVYSSMAKGAYKGVPLILGGIEASLRRLSHFDYWSNKVRHSILQDSKADLLVYGMGESPIIELARRLNNDELISDIKNVKGTICFIKKEQLPKDALQLPSFEDIKSDKKAFADSFKIQYKNTDPFSAKQLVEQTGNRYILQNRPSFPITQKELDRVSQLPYTKAYHLDYNKSGGIPALEEILFSLNSSRGCFGGCSFCAITFHQGKLISARSHTSLIEEAKKMIKHPEFKGFIHDVGGPTANFRLPACAKQEKKGSCVDKECLGFDACKTVNPDHSDYLDLLRKLRKLPGVKKVFIRSGIRYDYLLLDKDDSFFKELVEHHVSGQLRVAPEHASDKVLRIMNKPPIKLYNDFKEKFISLTNKIGKKQFVIPYLISSHPGATLKEAIELAEFLKASGFIPDQVQDFYPTPGTLSTAIYHCGFNPIDGEKIFTALNERDKKMQKALLHFHKPENYKLVKEALILSNRKDLIGNNRECLIKQNPPFQGNLKQKSHRYH